ncbi:MAG: penicillin-binding protein 2 [Thermodesulfobacteriota bacterium]
MKIPRNPFSEDPEDLSLRHSYLMLAAICFFLVLAVRLWYLQIIRGYEYRRLSETNRIRIQESVPPRGLIYDRNGLLLVDNQPSFELAVLREDVPDPKGLTAQIAYLLGRPWSVVEEAYEAASNLPRFQPARMLTDLTLENVVALKTHQYELPGVVIQVKPKRRYLHDFLASHVVGYLGEITKEQLELPAYHDHRAGDMVGQYGIEREWETELHGERGWSKVEVNAAGRVQRLIETVNPKPGLNLYLTLDARMQKVAQEVLGEQAGAVVGVDPKTGEILFMASTPTFSQNDFVQGISPEKWQALLENPLHPLENRAVTGRYPPGSCYKIIAATAALEEGVANAKTRVVCTGGYPFGDRVFQCWKKSGHGSVNLHRSLVESCDVFYYEMSLKLGVDRLAKWARYFGLGETSGVGLTGEKPGVVPDKAWKLERIKKRWVPGETLNVGIGQGYTLATPLQMAMAVSVIANGGTLYKPHIVKKITDTDNNTVKYYYPEVVRDLRLKPDTVKMVQQALAGVVNELGGTGFRARMEDVIVAGKTGTAQVVTLKRYRRLQDNERPYRYRDHAWFVAFAPAENPQIALAVLIEHGGGGGAVAAPVAKKVLEAFFHPEAAPPQDEKQKTTATEEDGGPP